jgi:GT2 family glycosyltransferase
MSEIKRHGSPTISVVTPTLDRPDEVKALLANLAAQTHLPVELVLVDGAPPMMDETQRIVDLNAGTLPYGVRYIRHGGGTAVQRNIGIDAARGDFIAFIDDDNVFPSDFFAELIAVFGQDNRDDVAAVTGYITNLYLDAKQSPRWRWYRRLGLFTTYEPGRFDFQTGYPINRYLQPPHNGLREIDLMGAGCAMWRRELFDSGLRFSPFFVDYGVAEDVHLALRARKAGWKILEVGRAHCVEMHSPRGRPNKRKIARKTAVNYRFLFVDIVPNRTVWQEVRFWRVQLFDLLRQTAWAIRRGQKNDWGAALGKIEGIIAATRVRPGAITPP